jgi:CheY-like chemotaxis protein
MILDLPRARESGDDERAFWWLTTTAHLTMLVAMLGSWGYEVDTADDGAMAVARCASAPTTRS